MENLVAALVARRFYLEGRSKKEIAEELGVSRFRVARILERALAEGIVRIQIDAPPEVDLDLSHALAGKYGLRQAVVVRGGNETAAVKGAGEGLGRACVALLAERLTGDDVLGVSWGRTLHALAGVLPQLPPAKVVQLVGSLPSADLAVHPLALLQRLGESTGGEVHALHVPMVIDDPAVAASLRSTAHVAETLAMTKELTIAVVGIGAWVPGGSSLREALPAAIAQHLDAQGAVADICSTVIDDEGRPVGADVVPPRCISITPERLRAVPEVIALAGGAAKADAIAAALRAGLVHRLITDSGAARLLLEDNGREPGSDPDEG